jgi:hypothetical protein
MKTFPFSSPAQAILLRLPKAIGIMVVVGDFVINGYLPTKDDQKHYATSSILNKSWKVAGSSSSSFLWFVQITIFEESSEKFIDTGNPFSSLQAAKAT